MSLNSFRKTPITQTTIIDEISFQKIYSQTKLPIINVLINNELHYFVIDTGANINVLNESIANQLNLNYTNTKDKVFGINNTQELSKTTILNLIINDHDYSDEFSILNISQVLDRIKYESSITVSGLLGIPFLNKYKAILHLSNNSIQLKCTI